MWHSRLWNIITLWRQQRFWRFYPCEVLTFRPNKHFYVSWGSEIWQSTKIRRVKFWYKMSGSMRNKALLIGQPRSRGVGEVGAKLLLWLGSTSNYFSNIRKSLLLTNASGNGESLWTPLGFFVVYCCSFRVIFSFAWARLSSFDKETQTNALSIFDHALFMRRFFTIMRRFI